MSSGARVLGGVLCDPTTAKKIAEVDGMALFRTRSGRFFLEMTFTGDLSLLSDDKIEAWLDRYAPDKKTAALAPEKKVHVTVDINADLMSAVDKARGIVSRRDFIEAALRAYMTYGFKSDAGAGGF